SARWITKKANIMPRLERPTTKPSSSFEAPNSRAITGWTRATSRVSKPSKKEAMVSNAKRRRWLDTAAVWTGGGDAASAIGHARGTEGGLHAEGHGLDQATADARPSCIPRALRRAPHRRRPTA